MWFKVLSMFLGVGCLVRDIWALGALPVGKAKQVLRLTVSLW